MVFHVKEAATILLSSGVTPESVGLERFQEDVFRLTRTLEASAQNAAETFVKANPGCKPPIVLCDRGYMDARAYVDDEQFGRILRGQNMTMSDARDARYDIVVHMVTSPPEFYGKQTNEDRREDYEGAVKADLATRRAWTGHPHYKIINNETEFDAKISRAVSAICAVVGEPEPYECERKFLLAQVPDVAAIAKAEGVHVETSVIHQTYLLSDGGEESRIRQRMSSAGTLYSHTTKGESTIPGVRPEKDRLISSEEYMELFAKRNPAMETIVKERHCFVYGDSHFEMDVYIHPSRGRGVLEVEVESMEAKVELPPFVRVAHEITQDKRYSNSAIARSGFPAEGTVLCADGPVEAFAPSRLEQVR